LKKYAKEKQKMMKRKDKKEIKTKHKNSKTNQ
jgi:hypothetical protein